MDWIAFALGITAKWLVGNKRKIGFVVYLCANVFWIIVALTTGLYGLLTLTLISSVVNVRNLLRWDKDEKGACRVCGRTRDKEPSRQADR